MLARSEQKQVAALHGLPARNDASHPPFYSFKKRRLSAMASDSELEHELDVEETAPPPKKKEWTAAPTPIATPGRTRNAAAAANNNVRNNRSILPIVSGWPSRNVPQKIQKLEHTPDVSTARKSSGSGPAPKEVIVLDDEEDTRSRLHNQLGITYEAPFSPPKDKNKKKRTAEDSDPILSFDDDDDLEIVDTPNDHTHTVPVAAKSPRRQTRHSTPTRYPSVRQRVATIERRHPPLPPDHDFSAPVANGKRLPVRDRMKAKPKPKTGTTGTGTTSLMAGRDAREVELGSRSRFGKGLPASVSKEEAEKRVERTKRFGPVAETRSVASTSSSSSTKRNPPFAPVPVTAFCLGMERWCDGPADEDGAPDVWLVVGEQTLEVFLDAGCTQRHSLFKKDQIERFEMTSTTCPTPGGLRFRIKPHVPGFNSPLFDVEDGGLMGWIVLRFAPFAPDAGWTQPLQEKLLGFIVRFAEKTPGYITPATLDNFISQACQEAVVMQQAHLLNPPPAKNAKKRASNGGEDIRRHLMPKDKGKEKEKDKEKDKGVAAESFYSNGTGASTSSGSARWSGDAGEAGPSMHLRSRRSSSTYRAPDADDSDDPIDALPPVLVKRPSRAREKEKEKEKENLEEIILVWPRGGPGALNISLGDQRRLQPGEFLNDTLIEFGLKYWLHCLRLTSPETADEVHVFSSFFYKKLNQKNFEEGYQSVRKWTNKVDIFKKKYVIVPINEHIHWYLAIIYQPEFVLRPPPPKAESPRRVSTRILAKQLEEEDEEEKGKVESGTATPAAAEIVEVEDDELAQDQEPVQEQQQQPDQVPMDVDVDGDAMSVTMSVTGRFAQSSLEDPVANVDPALREEADVDVDVRFFEEEDTEDEAPLLAGKGKRAAPRARSISLGSGQPPALDEAGEPTAAPTPATIDEEEDEVVAEVAPEPEFAKLPYIFTFDSLGGRHPQAIKNLQKYLAAEAEDKRKIPRDRTTVPDGKKATVPTQPNYCDCGLYLLHFAEMFVGEPEKYTRAILTPPKKQRDDKNKLWQNHELANKREALDGIIKTLSQQWREEKKAEEEEAKAKAVKEQDQEKAKEDSDDDIVIESVVVLPPPKKATIKAGRPAARK